MTGRGMIHHALGSSARHLSPLPRRCGILRLPLPATGRGWAHSPSSWQRAAPGRRAEWLEIREARTQPFPVKCQQWRGAGDRPSGSRCDGARSGNGQRAPEAKDVPRDTNRRRGCRKATPGPRGPESPQGLSEEAREGLLELGDQLPGCRRGTRVTRRTSGPPAGDGRRVGDRAILSSTVRATKSDMTTRINHPDVLADARTGTCTRTACGQEERAHRGAPLKLLRALGRVAG